MTITQPLHHLCFPPLLVPPHTRSQLPPRPQALVGADLRCTLATDANQTPAWVKDHWESVFGIYIYLSIHPSIHLSVRVLCPYDLSETMVLEVSLDVGMAGPGPSIGKVAAVSVGDPVGASFLMNLVGALPLFKMLCSWHGSSKVLVTTTICDHDRFFL